MKQQPSGGDQKDFVICMIRSEGNPFANFGDEDYTEEFLGVYEPQRYTKAEAIQRAKELNKLFNKDFPSYRFVQRVWSFIPSLNPALKQEQRVEVAFVPEKK